ncbi:MAG: sigma-70 family RNA polymerase sigma factor [Oscillospiraceae bacterium]|nr:sigma-70 family RNA polymerase sigma factor [Oscillospiraceae bacterium]
MKRTLYEGYEGPRLSPATQMQRIRRVIERELTSKQREIILAYYFQDKSIPEIAAERGIHKSSVCRCLQRAEKRVRHCLKY